MVMEEQIAQSTLSAVMQGATLILRISGRTANILGSATSSTIGIVGKTTKDTLRRGRESIVHLTKKSGGDLHFTEQLSREDMRKVRALLHEYGVHYGIEKNPDTGKFYLVFKGSDADMVKHALERVLEKVDGHVAIDPVVIPEQNTGINEVAENVAMTKASDLVPEFVIPDADPPFTLQFKTVQWDREGKLVSDNLTKLGIPFTVWDSGNGMKNFTFPQSCRPAVKEFIDSYSQTVKSFDATRFTNYKQLDLGDPKLVQETSVKNVQPVDAKTLGKKTPPSDVAVTKGSDLMPKSIPDGDPQFTMQFKTVKWDRDGKIVSDNLTKMGVPFTVTDASNGIRNYAFPQSCRPAVKEFIDSYSDTVKYFDTKRVVNYKQLDLGDPKLVQEVSAKDAETRVNSSTQPTPVKSEAPESIQARETKKSEEASPDVSHTPVPEDIPGNDRMMDQATPAKASGSESQTPRQKKSAADVRRELKQDTRERIKRSRGAAPAQTVSKAKTR